MSERLKKLATKLIELNKQLSSECLDLKQKLATALSNQPDPSEAKEAEKRAKAAEELNKSLTDQLKALTEKLQGEEAEEEDLASQLEPYLKEAESKPTPLEMIPPSLAKTPSQSMSDI